MYGTWRLAFGSERSLPLRLWTERKRELQTCPFPVAPSQTGIWPAKKSLASTRVFPALSSAWNTIPNKLSLDGLKRSPQVRHLGTDSTPRGGTSAEHTHRHQTAVFRSGETCSEAGSKRALPSNKSGPGLRPAVKSNCRRAVTPASCRGAACFDGKSFLLGEGFSRGGSLFLIICKLWYKRTPLTLVQKDPSHTHPGGPRCRLGT